MRALKFLKRRWTAIVMIVVLLSVMWTTSLPAFGSGMMHIQPTTPGTGLWEVDGTETQLITADELDIQNKSILNVLDIDGRDISTDGAKLDAIEALADVTDAANVALAGALMDSGTDIITNLHIDWGSGVGQVDADDVPDSATRYWAGETGADVTDADNVNDAGAVMESDFNATTFMYATLDNTPEPKTPVDIVTILGLNLVENATHSTDTHTMTIDGRDVSVDGAKLDTIEEGATKYPDAGEQAFLDADHTKLDAIEALADVTDAYNVIAAVMDCNFQMIPTAGGWTTAIFGSGVVGQAPFRNFVYVNAGADGSYARVYTQAYGFNEGGTYQYINWDKELWFIFNYSRYTSDAGVEAWVQLAESGITHADLASEGIGIVVKDMALYGESYGTSRAEHSLSTTLANQEQCQIAIHHSPGNFVKWYVNGVLQATEDTAGEFPAGAGTSAIWMNHAMYDGGAATAGLTVSNMMQGKLWQAG